MLVIAIGSESGSDYSSSSGTYISIYMFLFLRCGVLLACIGPEMSRMYRHCNFLIMNSLCLCCVPVDIFFYICVITV